MFCFIITWYCFWPFVSVLLSCVVLGPPGGHSTALLVFVFLLLCVYALFSSCLAFRLFLRCCPSAFPSTSYEQQPCPLGTRPAPLAHVYVSFRFSVFSFFFFSFPLCLFSLLSDPFLVFSLSGQGSCGTVLRTHLLWNGFENRKRTFLSGRKTRHTEFGRQPYRRDPKWEMSNFPGQFSQIFVGVWKGGPVVYTVKKNRQPSARGGAGVTHPLGHHSSTRPWRRSLSRWTPSNSSTTS